MRRRGKRQSRLWTRVSLGSLLQGILILTLLLHFTTPSGRALVSSPVATIAPSQYPPLFGSTGSVVIQIPKPGIAVRVEIPREFLQTGDTVRQENDTSFITTNIRNDYYYYNLVDESQHWTYNWHNNASDGPCFKPAFSYYDPNAPYCLEIWNYLSSPVNYLTNPASQVLKQPDHTIYCYMPGPSSYYDSAPSCASLTPGQDYFDHSLFPKHIFDYTYLVGVDYCQPQNLDKYVFQCFNPSSSFPKFILLHDLSSPQIAGLYTFTVFVANRTNILGYPDFVHAWSMNLTVPVSSNYNPSTITAYLHDVDNNSQLILAKGVVTARLCTPNLASCPSLGPVVARTYIDPSTGKGILVGLDPNQYYALQGSAGIYRGFAYSPSDPRLVVAQPGHSVDIYLNEAPQLCGSITYYDLNNSTRGFSYRSLSDNSYLLIAGFRSNPLYNLNVTVEATFTFNSVQYTYRYRGVSTDTNTDSFNVTTGVDRNYVSSDPLGTEFAGLPDPSLATGGSYSVTLNVWIAGYLQGQSVVFSITPSDMPRTTHTCKPIGSVKEVAGGIISGIMQFWNGQGVESPFSATAAAAGIFGNFTDRLYGGNIVAQASAKGFLGGVTVINGTLPNGVVIYENSTSIPFYITGFSEYYDHSSSGVWNFDPPVYGRDYGLPVSLQQGPYSLSIFVRGYNLTSTIYSSSNTNQTVLAQMTRGGAFRVTVGSYDNRPGTCATQARLPWRFLDSSIPVRARVYFGFTSGCPGCYVERIMQLGAPNGVDTYSFTVPFAGQNWSLREIYFYQGFIQPSYIGNGVYTLTANTLGYVPCNRFGRTTPSFPNNLLGYSQAFLALFYANEVDITVPICLAPQTCDRASSSLRENDYAIGQVSGGSVGAEMSNVTTGTNLLSFNIYGYGGMQLNATLQVNTTYRITLCRTSVYLTGVQNICGQGHFFYVAPDGTRNTDYGIDVGQYTGDMPELGFKHHFMNVLKQPVAKFTDLFQQQGVYLKLLQMAAIGQCASEQYDQPCPAPALVFGHFANGTNAPLSWAQVGASNSTYTSPTVPTFDGAYDGVGALFVPAGSYTVTFSDVQYQSQSVNETLGWGAFLPLNPPLDGGALCPIGATCPTS